MMVSGVEPESKFLEGCGVATMGRKSSSKAKIRESGLWLVNELYNEPLSLVDLDRLRNRVVAGAGSVAPFSRNQNGIH